MNNKENLVSEFIGAIKRFGENPETLENFEDYLNRHFKVWLEKYAHTSKDSFEYLTSEIKHFSEIQF